MVQVKNGLYLLTVGASVEFLTDENTVYPVYIDPTLTIDSGTNYIEDTTIYAGKPAINYGTDTKLVVGTGSPSYGVGRAVVRIPGIYESVALEDMMPANILSATFTVRPYSSPAASQTLYLHPLEDYTWTESGATWNSITAGGYSNSAWSSATVGTSVATFNITSLAKEWPYGAYYPDSGFLIKLADDKEESGCKRLYTTEYTTASYRPYATFTYLEDGVYRIKNMNSNLYLQAKDGKINEGTEVIQYFSQVSNPNRLSQLWKVKALSDGTFSIRPMHDPTMGLSIDESAVEINSTSNPETSDMSAFQKWILTATNGYLAIKSSYSSTKCLEPLSASSTIGANVTAVNYMGSISQVWLFEEATNVMPGVLLYDTTTGMRLDGTVERTLIKDTTATLEDYNIKAVYYSPTSITQNFSYSSGNSTVLTVNSYGTISGIKDGVASVSISSGGYSKSFSLRVLPFANGVYFIENKEYPGYYVQGDDDYSDENLTGEILELREFSGASRQQWTLTHIGGGYYKLATVGGVLSVNAEYLHEEDEALIIDSDLGLDRQKWKITQTVNGSFKLKAKSSESYTTTDLAMVCGTRAAGVTNGVNVEQRKFMGENDSYKDEWRFFRIEFASSTPLEGQEMNLWCWVTTAEMFARNYYPSITATQADAVRNVCGSVTNTPGDSSMIIKAINYYVSTVSDETMDLVYYQNRVYSQNTLMQFLKDGNVVGVTIGKYELSAANRTGGHAVLIYGYVMVDSDIYFLVKDPSPVGDGDIYMISYEDLYCETKVNNDETIYYVWETAIVTKGLYSGQTIPYYYGE